MPERREPVWGYRDLALFLSAVLPSLALAALLSRASRMVAPDWFFSDAVRTLVFQSFMYVFLVGALYLVVAWRYGEPFLPSLGWTFPIPHAFMVLAAGPALALATPILPGGKGTRPRRPVVLNYPATTWWDRSRILSRSCHWP